MQNDFFQNIFSLADTDKMKSLCHCCKTDNTQCDFKTVQGIEVTFAKHHIR